MDDKTIAERLIALSNKGLKFSNELEPERYHYRTNYREKQDKYLSELVKWKGECLNLLRIKFGGNSVYFNDFVRRLNVETQHSGEFYQENVKGAVGVLSYIADALINGLTDDLFYQKEVILFQDLLGQAEEFLNKGYNLAAAIYGRISLELTLREFATKEGIENSKISFEQLTIEMRKHGLIHPPFEKSLSANYNCFHFHPSLTDGKPPLSFSCLIN
ncbi:hypothetical protein HY449_02320 [Candidatus Pacearchaeota archaeon]|nr:hypothetical protein [Candidatus Pacearchaeota archaeon]